MKKKVFALALALSLSLSLAACGSSGASSGSAVSGSASGSGSAASSGETVTLKVAASPTPHAEILEQVKPILAEQGIDLVIDEYSDYVVPNTAVEDGLEDAIWTSSMRRTAPTWSASERFTTSPSASIPARPPLWRIWLTAPSSPSPTTPPTRPAPCCCWKPTASSL